MKKLLNDKDIENKIVQAIIHRKQDESPAIVAAGVVALHSKAINGDKLNEAKDSETINANTTSKLAAAESKNNFDDGFVSEKPNSKPEIAMNPAEVLDGGVGLLGKLKDKRTVAAATAPKPSAHNMV